MSGKNIIFDDKKISKSNFYKNKKLFSIYDIEVDKILISKKESYGNESILMSIEFDDSEHVYGDNDKCIKVKIKSYGDKVNVNFQDKKIPKENASYNCKVQQNEKFVMDISCIFY